MATSSSTWTPITTTTGCSGIIGDRIYSVDVQSQTSSFTLSSTPINGNTTTGTKTPCLKEQPLNFIYSACTMMSSPASVALVGHSSSGSAEMYTVTIPSLDQCQLDSHPYTLSGVSHALSVVPAPCSSQTSAACFAILGLSSNSTSPQYVIQYPILPSSSNSSSSSTNNTVSLPPISDTTIHPMLAVSSKDLSKMYVIGYPTKNQILIRPNSNQQQTEQPTSSNMSGTILVPTPTLSTQSLDQVPVRSGGAQLGRRALSTSNINTLIKRSGESYIKLDMSIDNMGPVVSVGDNLVVLSNTSFIVQTVPVSLIGGDGGDLRVGRVDLLPSSQVSDAGSLVGIDSLIPIPSQHDGSSSVFVTYSGNQGNHVLAAINEPSLFTSTGDSGTSSNGPSDSGAADNNSGRLLSTGAIVGIIIGCIVAGVLFALGFIFLYRRRKQQQQNKKQPISGEDGDISMTDRRFLSEKLTPTPTTNYQSLPIKDDSTTMRNGVVSGDSDDDGYTSAAMAATAIDSLTRPINNSPMQNNNDYYHPTSTNDTLLLDSFVYHLRNEAPTYAVFPQGYATRSATRTLNMTHPQQKQQQQQQQRSPIECTIHYFPGSAATWFGQLLQTSINLQDRQQGATGENDNSSVYGGGGGTFGLFTYDAIRLSDPTNHGKYQYLWITSPYRLHHTLHYLLFDAHTVVVDSTQFSFKAWSTLSMLKALHQVHEHGWLHRKINTFSFFYDQASTVTDWSLSGFYQSKFCTGQLETHPRLVAKSDVDINTVTATDDLYHHGMASDLLLDECTAPEWMDYMEINCRHPPPFTTIISHPSMDIWSLGCVLYTVATGKRAFQHVHEYQALLAQSRQHLQVKLDTMLDEVALVDDSYKELLRRMLQIDPHARDSLPSLIDFWIHANQLDDDDE